VRPRLPTRSASAAALLALAVTAGCTGTFTVPLDTGHAGAANLSAIFGASYTDSAGLNGTAEVRFTPPAPPHGGN